MAINYKEIASILESTLFAYWATQANTPIFVAGTTINTTESYYLVVDTVFSDTIKIDIPKGCTAEVIGTFSVQVVGPQQTGRRYCFEYADLINAYFSDTQIGIVNTDAGRHIDITDVNDNKYRRNVLVPFSVYQTT